MSEIGCSTTGGSLARRVEMPAEVAANDLLDRVDYCDAFAADCPPEVLARYTPDELGRLAMGRAPRWLRVFLRIAQGRVLGLRLTASTLDDSLGWQRLQSGAKEAVYGTSGGLITPRLVVVKEFDRVLIVFLMQQERAWAAPIVAIVKPIHRAVVRCLLDRSIHLAVGP